MSTFLRTYGLLLIGFAFWCTLSALAFQRQWTSFQLFCVVFIIASGFIVGMAMMVEAR